VSQLDSSLKKWLAVFEVPGIDHAGDIRMSQRSENLLFREAGTLRAEN
jgi:hypothetical protein